MTDITLTHPLWIRTLIMQEDEPLSTHDFFTDILADRIDNIAIACDDLSRENGLLNTQLKHHDSESLSSTLFRALLRNIIDDTLALYGVELNSNTPLVQVERIMDTLTAMRDSPDAFEVNFSDDDESDEDTIHRFISLVDDFTEDEAAFSNLDFDIIAVDKSLFSWIRKNQSSEEAMISNERVLFLKHIAEEHSNFKDTKAYQTLLRTNMLIELSPAQLFNEPLPTATVHEIAYEAVAATLISGVDNIEQTAHDLLTPHTTLMSVNQAKLEASKLATEIATTTKAWKQ